LTIPGALGGVEGWLADHRDSCVDWGLADSPSCLGLTISPTLLSVAEEVIE